MFSRIWNFASAAAGMAIVLILIAYGTEYGTWIDEIGGTGRTADGRTIDSPAVTPLVVVVLLAVVVCVGGLIAGLVGVLTASRTQRIPPAG